MSELQYEAAVKRFRSEQGKKGGAKTMEKHGTEHYQRMSAKGVEARKAKGDKYK